MDIRYIPTFGHWSEHCLVLMSYWLIHWASNTGSIEQFTNYNDRYITYRSLKSYWSTDWNEQRKVLTSNTAVPVCGPGLRCRHLSYHQRTALYFGFSEPSTSNISLASLLRSSTVLWYLTAWETLMPLEKYPSNSWRLSGVGGRCSKAVAVVNEWLWIFFSSTTPGNPSCREPDNLAINGRNKHRPVK